MAGISERDLFRGYGLAYNDQSPAPEPVPVPREAHVLTPAEIRQRVAAHHDRQAEERAVATVRNERMRVAS